VNTQDNNIKIVTKPYTIINNEGLKRNTILAQDNAIMIIGAVTKDPAQVELYSIAYGETEANQKKR